MTKITQAYIDLCIDEMNAISEASITLIREMVAAKEATPMTQAQLDRRRAELYREHLDAAGIRISRTKRKE